MTLPHGSGASGASSADSDTGEDDVAPAAIS